MTFTLRSQAFYFFIYITIICHEISQFSVCLHQVVLCEGICIACDALFIIIVYKTHSKNMKRKHEMALKQFADNAGPDRSTHRAG